MKLWKLLESIVLEAKTAADYRDALLRYVTRRYDEHTADELRSALQRMQFKDFQQHVATTFMNSEMNGIVKNMLQAAIAQHRAKTGKAPPQVQRAGDDANYVSPDDAAEKEKAIDAARKLRASAGKSYDAARTLQKPSGDDPTHAVGSAGQHQPKAQPSVSAGVQPQQNSGAKSGLVGAQRAVDRLTKEKGEKAGNALAARLGVPTSAERTKVDPVSGEKSIQIWSPDRVMKFMDVDQNPNRKAPTDGGNISRTDLVKMGVMKRLKAPDAGKMGPGRPPAFDGERWKPHGVSSPTVTARPDVATGNYTWAKRDLNPKDTGQELVGLNGKWVLPSVYDATKAMQGAAAKSAGVEPGRGHQRSGTADDKAGHAAAGDRELMRKLVSSPRLQQKLKVTAKERGVDLKGDKGPILDLLRLIAAEGGEDE